MDKSVQLKNGCLYIGGKATVLLCSSLFYFRIPPAFWQVRMRQLKNAGYNAIDVYFPWNFHETQPGEWCFEGTRDVDRFLALAAGEGLFVVARPGPYICSEWDGGGMPPWLSDRVGGALRQYDALYLAELSQWMDRILPILAKRQYGREGSVVLLQLENELDLFPCRHPRRFVGRLAEMAAHHGFSIPFIACAGGHYDLEAAGGTAANVAPSYNLYPGPDDPAFEEQMKAFEALMRQRGQTFLTTETDREHRTLRREVTAGLRLISPYCQTASHDYDMFNAISSWGNSASHPLAYMTNDYDHGAMIKADGCVTEEYLEARLLGNLLYTFGEDLAAGTPFAPHGIEVETTFETNLGGLNALRLQTGGLLLCLPNLGHAAGMAHITCETGAFTVPVPAKQTLLLPCDLSLARWGLPQVTVNWSAYELAWAQQTGQDVNLVLYGEGGMLSLSLPGASNTLVTESKAFQLETGTLTLTIMSRQAAARAQSPFLPAFGEAMATPFRPEPAAELHHTPFAYPSPRETKPVDTLEHLGVYRGLGTYELAVPPCKKVLLQGASDILTLSHDGTHLSTFIGTGGHEWVGVQGGLLEVRAEIWGHSCFEAPQYPVMRMGSQRGIRAAYAVMEEVPIPHNWAYHPTPAEHTDTIQLTPLALPPILRYGGRLPLIPNEAETYRKEVLMPKQGDTRLLWLKGCALPTRAFIDGSFAGSIHPSDPYLDITAFTLPGKKAELALCLEKSYPYEQCGEPTLLGVQKLANCHFAPFTAEDYTALTLPAGATATALPLALAPGSPHILEFEVPECEGRQWLRFDGHGVKVTAIYGGMVLGRFFVGCAIPPVVCSGDPLRAWLPGNGGTCLLVVEAMETGAALDAILLDRR